MARAARQPRRRASRATGQGFTTPPAGPREGAADGAGGQAAPGRGWQQAAWRPRRAAAFSSRVPTACAASASKLAVGSSASRTAGWRSRARARAVRCRSPRLSTAARRSRVGDAQLVQQTPGRGRAGQGARGRGRTAPAAARCPWPTGPAAGACPGTPGPAGPAASGPGQVPAWPKGRHRPSAPLPADGRSMPARACSRLVLPAPDGPSTAVALPGARGQGGDSSARGRRPGRRSQGPAPSTPRPAPPRRATPRRAARQARRNPAPRSRAWLTKPLAGSVQEPSSRVPVTSITSFGAVGCASRRR